MNIIPAIDLLGGKAVRLQQGRYDQVTVYDPDPVGRARRWRGLVSQLHVVDLEGAKGGHAIQKQTVRAIVEAFGPGVQVGGGVRTQDAFEAYRVAGASRVVFGSVAVKNPYLVRLLASYDPGAVIVAVDAKDGMVATEGWTEVSTVSAIDLVRSYGDLALGAILYTDIARDGTRVGPNVEATAALAKATSVPVIASGGVGTLEHLRELAKRGIHSAIVGRALYDGSFTLEEAIEAGASG
jgi:phosphoribosylformimino-5-aminoimidazole carboxamide ribotide isomerase